MPQPPLLQLSSANTDRHGAYLMDTGEHMILWLGAAISDKFCQDVLEKSNFATVPDNMVYLHISLIFIINPFTTIHDGNFRRHSSMYVTIHDGNFRRIYYSYTRICGSWYALRPGSEEVKVPLPGRGFLFLYSFVHRRHVWPYLVILVSTKPLF